VTSKLYESYLITMKKSFHFVSDFILFIFLLEDFLQLPPALLSDFVFRQQFPSGFSGP
jgi:hypothetical protein